MSAPVLGWDCVWKLHDERDEMHVTPYDDLVGHELYDGCACGPYVEYLGGEDWLVVHQALDGRP